MTLTTPKIGTAVASPAKDFFVQMLTRDIELQDAILDLLDNCVDGIVRAGFPQDAPLPFEGYRAVITMAPEHFIIEDNCGGIPIEIAKKYAFSMGRPPGAGEAIEGPTVGMYGIGMKRAIFKLGTEALVESRHDTGFVVEFTPEWMRDENWSELPMHQLADDELTKKGTRNHSLRDQGPSKISLLRSGLDRGVPQNSCAHLLLDYSKGLLCNRNRDRRREATDCRRTIQVTKNGKNVGTRWTNNSICLSWDC